MSRRYALASRLLLAALLTGCTEGDRGGEDDLYTRCKNDPKCRGQQCVDVRAELWSRGDHKSARMLDCSAGGL